jgi:hypothetical protein
LFPSIEKNPLEKRGAQTRCAPQEGQRDFLIVAKRHHWIDT